MLCVYGHIRTYMHNICAILMHRPLFAATSSEGTSHSVIRHEKKFDFYTNARTLEKCLAFRNALPNSIFGNSNKTNALQSLNGVKEFQLYTNFTAEPEKIQKKRLKPFGLLHAAIRKGEVHSSNQSYVCLQLSTNQRTCMARLTSSAVLVCTSNTLSSIEH